MSSAPLIGRDVVKEDRASADRARLETTKERQMFSHTVPKKLLEQFAYHEVRTKSRRLWQYQKGLPPWWKASPGRATAWDGHFADPANAAQEEQIELRLKQEFEDP